jgi:hypothetical protein
MTDNQKIICKRVLNELKETLETINAEDSILGIESLDDDAMTITIKFRYQLVESNNYIGLCNY